MQKSNSSPDATPISPPELPPELRKTPRSLHSRTESWPTWQHATWWSLAFPIALLFWTIDAEQQHDRVIRGTITAVAWSLVLAVATSPTLEITSTEAAAAPVEDGGDDRATPETSTTTAPPPTTQASTTSTTTRPTTTTSLAATTTTPPSTVSTTTTAPPTTTTTALSAEELLAEEFSDDVRRVDLIELRDDRVLHLDLLFESTPWGWDLADEVSDVLQDVSKSDFDYSLVRIDLRMRFQDQLGREVEHLLAIGYWEREIVDEIVWERFRQEYIFDVAHDFDNETTEFWNIMQTVF